MRKEDEGSYTVIVPALPGCITYGENINEVLTMAKETIELYIEELQDRDDPVPNDRKILEYSLILDTA